MWRNLVAHLVWDQRVAGSNPVIPTIYSGMVEDGTRPVLETGGLGSIPRYPTNSNVYRIDKDRYLIDDYEKVSATQNRVL